MIIWFTFVKGIILKRIIELILWWKYSNSHNWIWIFTNDFKYFGQWCYWIGYWNTKLLQLDSSQNHFQKSNYDQNGDLDRFECTKFVHATTLVFLDSKVFYMFWGIHRLEICYCWITRAKDMNYLVLRRYFNHLKFISKCCTVTMWYYCTIRFYNFQGFQGYVICNFWTYGLKDIKFTSSGHILWFENQIWINLTRVWPVLTEAGYVASPYWPIPFRYGI
jgi:hypothetical protein